MSWLTNLFYMWFFGVVGFFVLPIFAAALPWEYAKRVISPYHSIAMTLLGRGIMLQRSHGGLTLKKSKFDPRFEEGAEMVRIGREKKHFRDPNDYMTTFKGRPFGLAHEDRSVIVNARVAYFGRVFRELCETGRFEHNEQLNAFFSIPKGLHELVNIADIKAIVQQSAAPGAASREETHAEKSQSMFDSRNIIDTMTWLIALGAGYGLVFGASYLAESTGTSGGSTIIPIVVGVWLPI